MDRLLIAAAFIVVAVGVALVLRRRKPDPPTQPAWTVPAQLDRADFARPDAPWLVAVFTSSTCASCADLLDKALAAARATAVAVHDVEFVARRDLHERYGIDAVPTLVVADAEGVVRGLVRRARHRHRPVGHRRRGSASRARPRPPATTASRAEAGPAKLAGLGCG